MAWTQQQLEEEIHRSDVWLLQQPGVTGVGIALDRAGRLCLQITTDQITAETRLKVEKKLNGLPLAFVESGPINVQ
jgi:hypothetical protein